MREIEIAQGCGDGLFGFFRIGVWLAEHSNALSLDKGQLVADGAGEQRMVQGAVRVQEDMRRAIMAIHAVHSSKLEFFEFFRA